MHSFKEPEIKKKPNSQVLVWNFNEIFEAAEGMAARKRLCYNDYITMLTYTHIYTYDIYYIKRARRDSVRSIDKNSPKQNIIV